MVVVRAVFNCCCFKDDDGEVDSLFVVVVVWLEDNVVGDFSCIERGGGKPK